MRRVALTVFERHCCMTIAQGSMRKDFRRRRVVTFDPKSGECDCQFIDPERIPLRKRCRHTVRGFRKDEAPTFQEVRKCRRNELGRSPKGRAWDRRRERGDSGGTLG
jgi:hypothetical protein